MIEDSNTARCFAQIADGLEETGALELGELGATGLRPVRRGIHFTADRAALYRINYCSRLCTRILVPVKQFVCPDAKAIYRAAGSVDWSRYFSVDQTFAVFASTAGSTVPHSQFAGLTLKDAVADQFRRGFGRRPNVDPQQPDLWINLFLHKDRGTISVDTSGGSLHRRGYRINSVEAPMQETVAAAMVRLSGWDGRRRLADPMCGSGTLVIEAAMACCGIPAGYLRRRFGFEQLPDYDPRLWKAVKTEMDGRIRKLPERMVYASDIDAKAVSATRGNCKRIPHARSINVLRVDFNRIEKLENHVILCNPPYGIRMQGGPRLDDFYRQLGDFLKQRCNGSEAFIYFGNREMIKRIGLKPAWKKPLRNGGLDGRVVKYAIY
ncbi:THUMP domain-containing class I SAM-dependent RNA methyltransferase [Desulfosarcina ovata]|uniref:RNA methyltransferase n=1 Tax=Desulfosarcina ovata subsp. ovata TaxID=2752305 RepID=A0A5K8A8G9_9BACT|nr:THUMP domain-containing protein [Desulfosarcina ovata]BBO88728.1 RNA methyltransferase [Desulfosarcina ovata subsp. ovata]